MKNKVRYLFADKINTLTQPIYFENMRIGSSANPLSVTYNQRAPVSMYFTCASTNGSTSFEPVLFHTVMTGAAQVGGRVRVTMETNVLLGQWANAFKALIDFKTVGGVHGIGSAICAEMVMPGGVSPGGTYGVLELAMVCPANWSGAQITSLIYAHTSGTTKSNFDEYGCLFNIMGVSDGNFYHSDVPGTLAAGLRVRISGTNYWIGLYSSKDD